MNPAPDHVAYLGPSGTFSELVARKRFGRTIERVPCPGIYEVFDYIRSRRKAVGIVPIENSSGGTIYQTIDCLVSSRRPLVILEELSLHVRLALLGHRGEKIHTLYSHFAPMQHCDPWIRRNLPRVERKETASTAVAAEVAATNRHAAALGMREAARRYGLDILEFPVQPEIPNVTQFVCVGHRGAVADDAEKTSLIVELQNRSGSLCELLEVFRDYGINMTRLLSRPIVGKPKTYIFFADIQGVPNREPVKEALRKARRLVHGMRLAGSYPIRRTYLS